MWPLVQSTGYFWFVSRHLWGVKYDLLSLLHCFEHCRQSEQNDRPAQEKKKPRPRDVFGRPLPTEEEFEVLKGAPRFVSVFGNFTYVLELHRIKVPSV